MIAQHGTLPQPSSSFLHRINQKSRFRPTLAPIEDYITTTIPPHVTLIPTTMVKVAAATSVVSEQALKLLKCANSFVSVPGVSAAADAALGILALAQTVHSNKADFIGVGEKACTIMVAVIRKVKAAEQPGSQTNMSALQEECQALCSTMEEIQDIVKKHVKGRKRFVLIQRILYSQSDQEVIKECKDKLQKALDLFNVESHIEVRQGVHDANRKLDDMRRDGTVGGGTTVTQHTGGNAWSHTEDNSVHVGGTGNSVNVSRVTSPQPAGQYYY